MKPFNDLISTQRIHLRRSAGARRGFNLVEMLIALSISAALLTAVMVALNASFMAYQMTTETASTHTIGRLTMHRMLTLIRTGRNFGPFPVNPVDSFVTSHFIEFETQDGQQMMLEWVENEERLDVVVFDPGSGVEIVRQPLLEGVVANVDPITGIAVPAFTLEFERGRLLYRATIDLTIRPDDNMSVSLDGDNQQTIRLVASAMPRTATY